MRKFHSIAALCGDGLRPELQALFDRLAVDPRTELFVRDDGMIQAGPNPAAETAPSNVAQSRGSGAATRGADALLGSMATSRTKGSHRNLGDPAFDRQRCCPGPHRE